MKKTELAVCALALTALLVSCGDSPTTLPDNVPVGTAEAVAETEPAEETVFYEADSLPSDLDFGGETVTTFGWSGAVFNEFYAEENGEIVDDAIAARNRTVEERLNVKLEYVIEPGAYNDRNNWVKSVSASIMAGDGAYDITSGYSMAGATLAYKRLVQDLTQLDYIDFSKPWWPASLIDEATVGGRLYFCSGDISTNMIYYLYAVYFNKAVLEAYDLESPYSLVTDMKWTVPKMMEYATAVHSDLNGNGAKDASDMFGFTVYSTWMDAFYFGSDLRTTERDENGTPVLSPTFGSEKTQALLETLLSWLNDESSFFGTTNNETEIRQIFMENRALFLEVELSSAAKYLRDMETDFGILPIPMYDEAQGAYYTVSSFPYSLYGVPVDAKNPSMSAAVMECLASESYRTVSPALFETAMKVKYSSDTESAQMFDIIRSSNIFDIGRIFNDSMDAKTYSLFRSSLIDNTPNWISTYTKNEKTMIKKLGKVIDALLAD